MDSFVEPHLPSNIPFQIIVQGTDTNIYHTILDEGYFFSILSSTSWQYLGYPKLLPTTNHLLDFNRRPSEPLGIFPQLPISLGGKTIYIDAMTVQGPLEFNFLLG